MKVQATNVISAVAKQANDNSVTKQKKDINKQNLTSSDTAMAAAQKELGQMEDIDVAKVTELTQSISDNTFSVDIDQLATAMQNYFRR